MEQWQRRRKTNADLPDPVQLHTSNVGEARQESGGPPRDSHAVYRGGRRKIARILVCFGDHDGYNLWEAPDNVAMAATAIAISGGGALSSIHTTVLRTVEDTLAAMK